MNAAAMSLSQQPRAILDSTSLADGVESAARACSQAGLETVRWRGDDALPTDASVLLAGLRCGDRRIPDTAMQLAGRLPTSIPLLLLCEEALIRPSVRLHEGRVTLVSSPFSAARVYSQLRILVIANNERRARVVDKRRRAHGGETRLEERATDTWWLGTLSASANGRHANLRYHGDSDGLTMLLPTSDRAIATKQEVKSAHAVAGSRSTDKDRCAALRNLLGERCIAIHFSPEAQSWTVYWPPRPGALVALCSAHRLPRTCRLAPESSEAELLELRAEEGDLLVSAVGEAGRWFESLSKAELTDGGPAVLHALAGAADTAQADGAAVLVEVRW